MSMTKREACDIIVILDCFYNMEFEKDGELTMKAKKWIEILSDKGDYEATKKACDKHIEESRYKPAIADVLVKPVHYLEDDYDDETKQHLYKMQHDPAYRKKIEAQKKKLQDRINALTRKEDEEAEHEHHSK